jgi:hypothetical protein
VNLLSRLSKILLSVGLLAGVLGIRGDKSHWRPYERLRTLKKKSQLLTEFLQYFEKLFKEENQFFYLK